jgi:hypothetical protein
LSAGVAESSLWLASVWFETEEPGGVSTTGDAADGVPGPTDDSLLLRLDPSSELRASGSSGNEFTGVTATISSFSAATIGVGPSGRSISDESDELKPKAENLVFPVASSRGVIRKLVRPSPF